MVSVARGSRYDNSHLHVLPVTKRSRDTANTTLQQTSGGVLDGEADRGLTSREM